MVIDIHSHFWDEKKHLTAAFKRDAAAAYGKAVPFACAEKNFLRDMEGADKIIVFGGHARHSGCYVPNDYIARFARKHPKRLVPFVSLDPNEPDMMEEFEKFVVGKKFRGVKLLPMYANFDPRDRRLDPVYKQCSKRGLPVMFHTGTTFCRWAPLRYTRPALLEEVAERFPDLIMIAAHLGHPYESECLVLIRKQPNIYADVSALHYRPWQFYNSMVLAQEYGVIRKILYGSDYPFTTPKKSFEAFARMNDMLTGTNLPRIQPETFAKICYENRIEGWEA